MSLPLPSNRYTNWTSRFSLKSSIAWAFYIVAGLVLSFGRYTWSAQTRSASWRGWLCSGFFFCLIIPLLSECLTRCHARPVLRNTLLAATTLLVSLPYRWLGLDRWFYYPDNKPRWVYVWNLPHPLKLVWFPQAFWGPPQIPRELLLFLFLTALLLGGAGFYWKTRLRAGMPLARSTVALGVSVIVLILVETAMHLSKHSPYTYICHFRTSGNCKLLV